VAVKVGTEAVEKFPDDPHLRFGLAEVFARQKRYSEALTHVERAIAGDPANARYRCFRTSSLLAVKRYAEAIEEAQSILRIDPEHLHSYDQIIHALIDSGRLKEAEQQAEELVKREPSESETLVSASRYYYSQKQFARACELLDKAVALDAKSVEARYARGLTHFELQHNTAARDDLKFVLAADPQFVAALCRLSDTLMRLKEYEEAVEAARRLIKLDPEHRHAYLVLGHALIKRGSIQQGIDALGQLVSRGTVSDLKMAADIAMDVGELSAAQKMIDRAIELHVEDAGVWEKQGLIQIRMDDLQAARLSMQKSRDLGSRSTLLQLALFSAESRTEPLPDALERLLKRNGSRVMLKRPRKFVETVAVALTTSIYLSGPIHLAQAVTMLRAYLSEVLDRGYIGEILTAFLAQAVTQLQGSIEEWESVLIRLRDSLGDLKDCRIPLAILSSAVKFTKTGNRRYLLELPLEQRQLLESALSKLESDAVVPRADRIRSGQTDFQ
jgi:tetratricopeptide (TPR) repeat protein